MHLLPDSPTTASQIAALFANDLPVPLRLWSILEGIAPGRVLVDAPAAPALALVQEMAEGTTYIGGSARADMLADGIAQLQQHQVPVVCIRQEDPLVALLPPAPSYQGLAIDFTDRSPAVDLRRLAELPAGYEMRRIDQDLVSQLDGFDYYVAMFGTLAQALEQTVGYCILHGGAVVSEAVAGPLVRGMAEIGVGTRETHRGRGLATAAAAQVIHTCEARGYRPFWNAAQQNMASIALARRLGFRTERPFAVFAW